MHIIKPHLYGSMILCINHDFCTKPVDVRYEDSVAKVQKGAAANFSPKERNKQRSPIDRALKPAARIACQFGK
jgi:hypothetical protein